VAHHLNGSEHEFELCFDMDYTLKKFIDLVERDVSNTDSETRNHDEGITA